MNEVRKNWFFSPKEDEVVLKAVEVSMAKGYSKTRAFEYAARELSRTVQQCRDRWYTIRKANNSQGSLKKRRTSSNIKIDDRKLVQLLKFYTHGGFSLKKALTQAAEEMGLSYTIVRGRWYNVLRDQYKDEVKALSSSEVLQAARDKRQSDQYRTEEATNNQTDDLDITSFINKVNGMVEEIKRLQAGNSSLKSDLHQTSALYVELEDQNRDLSDELHTLRDENKSLALQLEKGNKAYEELLEDYNEVLKVIEKARAIYVKEQDGSAAATSEKPRFRMDRNGNLEKI